MALRPLQRSNNYLFSFSVISPISAISRIGIGVGKLIAVSLYAVCRYTIVIVYYVFCLTIMMLMRPMLCSHLVPRRGTRAIYAALYFFPILTVLHAMAAGLICKSPWTTTKCDIIMILYIIIL